MSAKNVPVNQIRPDEFLILGDFIALGSTALPSCHLPYVSVFLLENVNNLPHGEILAICCT